MKILNLGCSTKVSLDPQVVNIDWSIKHVFARKSPPVLTQVLLGQAEYLKYQHAKKAKFILHDLRNGIPFEDNSIDVVYHSHMLEHIDRRHVDRFFNEVYRVLKYGGIHRIVVPDFFYLCNEYVRLQFTFE